jgi:hypothetical protein
LLVLQSSGVAVDDAVVASYDAIKMKSAKRWAMYTIDMEAGRIVIEKVGAARHAHLARAEGHLFHSC